MAYRGQQAAIPFYLQASAGGLPGYTTMKKFGRNPDIDNGVVEDVWSWGGTWTAPASAQGHTISSTSAEDDSSASGARTVQVWGLDENWLDQNEVVTMSGAGSALTSGSYNRIFRMAVITAGDRGNNTGVITATSGDDNVTAAISASDNQTLMAIYTVPANKTAYILQHYAGMNRNQTTAAVDYRVLVRAPGEVFQTKYYVGALGDGTSLHYHTHPIPLKVAEKSDIKISAVSTANNTDVFAGFDLAMIGT